MRIAMLDPGNYSPLYDANLCHALAGRGHEVSLATSEFLFEPVPPLGGYRVEYDFFRLVAASGLLRRRARTRRLVKAAAYPVEMARWTARTARRPPNVVHVEWSLFPLLDARLVARLRRKGARLVYTAHDVEPLPGSTWSAAGFARLYRQADAVIVHAEDARERLIAGHGVDARLVHVVPMGGPGAYAQEPSPRAEARRTLGLDPKAPYLLFFGLIKEHKGLDLLLEALALARRERPEVRLLVAGEPMGSWRPYAERIARLGLAGSVELRLGYIPNAKAHLYFGAADVAVLPYQQIFQSGVVLASYAFARPVVATDVGGLGEIVREGETGFLAPPDDPARLAETLLHALSDPAALVRMGATAASFARERHSWAHIAARHEEIYEESIRGGRNAPGQRRSNRL